MASRMASVDEQILRASKEIAVKFIETGRVSPAGFPELFETVYSAVQKTVKSHDSTAVDTVAEDAGKSPAAPAKNERKSKRKK